MKQTCLTLVRHFIVAHMIIRYAFQEGNVTLLYKIIKHDYVNCRMSESERRLVRTRKRNAPQAASDTEGASTASSHGEVNSQPGQQELATVMQSMLRFMEMQTAMPTQRILPQQSTIVPSFNPEEPQQSIVRWCQRIDELKVLYGWNDEVTVYNAMAKLEGLASRWYHSLPTIQYTWEQWKEELKKAFPAKRDYFQGLEKMMQRVKRRDESFISYYYEKVALLNECRIQGADAVSCIIGGISDGTIQTAARANDYQEPETLLNFLRSCDSSVTFQTASHPQSKGKVSSRFLVKSKEPRPRFVCFKCNKPGHKATECRVLKCNKCHRLGHREQDCRVNTKANVAGPSKGHSERAL